MAFLNSLLSNGPCDDCGGVMLPVGGVAGGLLLAQLFSILREKRTSNVRCDRCIFCDDSLICSVVFRILSSRLPAFCPERDQIRELTKKQNLVCC